MWLKGKARSDGARTPAGLYLLMARQIEPAKHPGHHAERQQPMAVGPYHATFQHPAHTLLQTHKRPAVNRVAPDWALSPTFLLIHSSDARTAQLCDSALARPPLPCGRRSPGRPRRLLVFGIQCPRRPGRHNAGAFFSASGACRPGASTGPRAEKPKTEQKHNEPQAAPLLSESRRPPHGGWRRSGVRRRSWHS